MTTLTNLAPSNSYQFLLTLDNSLSSGLTTSLRTIQDGLGNASTMQLATDKANFLTSGGNQFQLQGVALTASATNINSVCGSNTFTGTAGMIVPSGTTAERPSSPINGTIRYNTTTTKLEAYANGTWVDLT
jgi:hypothetical protein